MDANVWGTPRRAILCFLTQLRIRNPTSFEKTLNFCRLAYLTLDLLSESAWSPYDVWN